MMLRLPQPFEELDHTADAGVLVRGADPAETLARLVLAMTQLLSGGGALAPTLRTTLEIEPADRVSMAIDVLRELLYRFDTEHLMVCACAVDRFDPVLGTKLTLELGAYDDARHVEGTDLKAVTLHAARFEADADGWLAQIIFDV